MQKKITITVDERIYDGLCKRVGRGHVSRFIEELLRPLILRQDFEDAYRQMAQDEQREIEALEWSEATMGDVGDDPR